MVRRLARRVACSLHPAAAPLASSIISMRSDFSKTNHHEKIATPPPNNACRRLPHGSPTAATAPIHCPFTRDDGMGGRGCPQATHRQRHPSPRYHAHGRCHENCRPARPARLQPWPPTTLPPLHHRSHRSQRTKSSIQRHIRWCGWQSGRRAGGVHGRREDGGPHDPGEGLRRWAGRGHYFHGTGYELGWVSKKGELIYMFS